MTTEEEWVVDDHGDREKVFRDHSGKVCLLKEKTHKQTGERVLCVGVWILFAQLTQEDWRRFLPDIQAFVEHGTTASVSGEQPCDPK
jgi:hypothetical protein